MTKRILISGDSWGCGEWGCDEYGNYRVLHKGLEDYLVSDGFVVNNVSMGGINNKESARNLKKELLQNDSDFFDLIIWFQTDPIRDLRPYKRLSYTEISSYEQLIEVAENLLNETYTMLNNLNKKIVCIGGCSKLISDINNYNNLIPFIPSCIEEFTKLKAPKIWHSDWINELDNFSIDALDKLLIDKRIQDSLYEHEMVRPDHGLHMNRIGHKLLFNKIKNEFLK